MSFTEQRPVVKTWTTCIERFGCHRVIHSPAETNDIGPVREADAPIARETCWISHKQAEARTPPYGKERRSSMSGVLLLGGYSVLIVLASLAGGWIPSLIRLTHKRMQVMVSFVGGLMLGIGLLHLLPHAVYQMHSLEQAVLWMMIGLLTIFFLIRMFHFHQHAAVKLPAEIGHVIVEHRHEYALPTERKDQDRLDQQAGPQRAGQAAAGEPHDAFDEHRAHRLSWVGIAIGLALHSLMDGVAMAASVQAESDPDAAWPLWGVGTFLAVLLHKPLDAVSVTSLMAVGGWSRRWQNAVNVAFALTCPLGAFLFFGGVERISEHQQVIVGCGLAFSAGVFLCISLGDLLPEMEFHAHNRLPLSAALLGGIVLAWAIRFLEPEHHHGWNPSEPASVGHPDHGDNR